MLSDHAGLKPWSFACIKAVWFLCREIWFPSRPNHCHNCRRRMDCSYQLSTGNQAKWLGCRLTTSTIQTTTCDAECRLLAGAKPLNANIWVLCDPKLSTCQKGFDNWIAEDAAYDHLMWLKRGFVLFTLPGGSRVIFVLRLTGAGFRPPSFHFHLTGFFYYMIPYMCSKL